MTTLLIALGAMVLYIIAYHTYGRWLARKIFKLDPNALMPSAELNDDRDLNVAGHVWVLSTDSKN